MNLINEIENKKKELEEENKELKDKLENRDTIENTTINLKNYFRNQGVKKIIKEFIRRNQKN